MMRYAFALAGRLPLLLLSSLASVALGETPTAPASPAPTASPVATAPATPVSPVPLEVYGRLPQMEDVALSPDGTRIAWRTVMIWRGWPLR